MTINVETPDHGLLSFDADDWNGDKGELWIGDRETGEGVAQFSRGAWLFVYQVKAAEAAEDPDEAEVVEPPRQWPSLFSTPYTATVTDRDGDSYYHTGGAWHFDGQGLLADPISRDLNPSEVRSSGQFGPFTEVL